MAKAKTPKNVEPAAPALAASAATVATPAAAELAAWNEFKLGANLTRIPIPYTVTLGAVTFVGVVHVQDPLIDSFTDGVCLGAVNGSYHLDRNRITITLFDPTGQLLRADLELSGLTHTLSGRLSTRRLDGSWLVGPFVVLVRW